MADTQDIQGNIVEIQADIDRFFGADSQNLRFFFAPGRVNLIGEHTDYTGGYVFPASLNIGTLAVVRPRTDGRFTFGSTNFEQVIEIDGEHIQYEQEHDWANYPKGVLQQLQQKGHHLDGFDVLYHGNIPNGAGLSSSASIELVTAVLVNQLQGLNIPMVELVQLSQKAENQFIGVNCGIMDQFAVGMGKAEHAILLHCDSLEYEYVPLVLGEYRLVITNTNKRRGLADSKYNERRQECEDGFAMIKEHLPQLSCLGDLKLEAWEQVKHHVTAPNIRQRLEHVVTENDRVLRSQKALEIGDLTEFGQLMIQSHQSLRDLYEVTGDELDALFEAAVQIEGCIGSRMTGAGFGGCTVSLVHVNQIDTFKEQVIQSYQAKTGLIPSFYPCQVGDGAGEL